MLFLIFSFRVIWLKQEEKEITQKVKFSRLEVWKGKERMKIFSLFWYRWYVFLLFALLPMLRMCHWNTHNWMKHIALGRMAMVWELLSYWMIDEFFASMIFVLKLNSCGWKHVVLVYIPSREQFSNDEMFQDLFLKLQLLLRSSKVI